LNPTPKIRHFRPRATPCRVAALFVSLLTCCIAPFSSAADAPAATTAPWVPDQGDGTYKNPIIYADYSDPDVTRVGPDFYLVSSSFTCVPGLPVLHSTDLVNWTIINHALPRQVPEDVFNSVQNGKGVWAPSIRFHDGKFYIFYPDPDFGIYVVTATDPAGAWSKPVRVLAGKGLEDPCPLWDDDGKVYLVNAWVGSRGASPNRLSLTPLSANATSALGPGQDLILGQDFKVTGLEGPKFYKLNGYYYIFAPVGGVGHGTHAVFRAKTITGPYEYRSVLAQGPTSVNGPHQGGLVDTPSGEWWFIHFQDQGPYGRVDHLEPVTWKDGWPQMGENITADGLGQPVLTHKKPAITPASAIAVPQTSDDFASPALGLQWQWQANPDPAWLSLTANPGHLRLFAQPAAKTIFQQTSLLLQKFPAPAFQVTVKMEFSPAAVGEKAGLIVLADPCLALTLNKTPDGLRLSQTVRPNKPTATETESAGQVVSNSTVYLRLTVIANALCQFSYSTNGASFWPIGSATTVAMVHNSWIGAKFGLVALAPALPPSRDDLPKPGYADFDWIQVGPLPAPVVSK
jgi:beta-xylosidase